MNYKEIRNEFAELLSRYDLTFGGAEFGTNGEITKAMHERFDDKTFHGGLVCYSQKAASYLLGASIETARKCGIHSPYSTEEMTKKVRMTFVCDVALSVVLADGLGGSYFVAAGFFIGERFSWKTYEIPEADSKEMVLAIATMKIIREMERQVVDYYGK